MDKKILNEINSIKKMMGILSEQGVESDGQEYRRQGVKLNLIKNDKDYKYFIQIPDEGTLITLYKELTNRHEGEPSPDILQGFGVMTQKFLEYLAQNCENIEDCSKPRVETYFSDAFAPKIGGTYTSIDFTDTKGYAGLLWSNVINSRLQRLQELQNNNA